MGSNLLHLEGEGLKNVVGWGSLWHFNLNFHVLLVVFRNSFNDLFSVLVLESVMIPSFLQLSEIGSVVPESKPEIILLVELGNFVDFGFLFDIKSLLVVSECINLIHAFVKELFE